LEICSLGACNGVDSGGGATGNVCGGVEAYCRRSSALHLREEVLSLLVVGGVDKQPFFVLVIEDVLIRRVSDHTLPAFIVKVW
jgi:hypothetical protein